MFISKILSFIFVCLLAACGNSVSQTGIANQSLPKETTELSLKMEKSGCYGQCPIYDLIVQSDGKVRFDGKGYTQTIGKAENKLTEEQLKQLIAEIEKANFFSLDNAYNFNSKNCPNLATDSSSVTLAIKLNGKEKTINHYHGCWENKREEKQDSNSNKVKISNEDLTKRIFPQQLYILENKIDEIVETKRWIGERK